MLAELGDDGLDFDYDNIRPAAPHANRNPFKRSAGGNAFSLKLEKKTFQLRTIL